MMTSGLHKDATCDRFLFQSCTLFPRATTAGESNKNDTVGVCLVWASSSPTYAPPSSLREFISLSSAPSLFTPFYLSPSLVKEPCIEPSNFQALSSFSLLLLFASPSCLIGLDPSSFVGDVAAPIKAARCSSDSPVPQPDYPAADFVLR